MKSIQLRFALCFIVMMFAVHAVCAVPRKETADDKFLVPFEYDAKAPLHGRWAAMSPGPSYNLYKVVYDSANGEKVPALFYEPKDAKAPFPCIIMQHGYSSRKEDSIGMGALQITQAGYAVFAIDAQYHGEREVPGKDIFSTDIPSDAKALVQTVIDLRRAVDLLQTRKGVDPDRISYIGVSMGAILGSIFAGVESRVKAPVLVVGGGDWKTLVGQSEIGPAKVMRREIAKGKMPPVDKLAEEMSYVEPLNYIWRISPRPVLMINNTHDKLVPTAANKLLHEKAREPKEIVWLESIPGDPTGHIPPLKQMIAKALEWWGRQL
jgi:cephalosporin-C deacetylase-like acetyl esterase